jgi:hypothetical protein
MADPRTLSVPVVAGKVEGLRWGQLPPIVPGGELQPFVVLEFTTIVGAKLRIQVPAAAYEDLLAHQQQTIETLRADALK